MYVVGGYVAVILPLSGCHDAEYDYGELLTAEDCLQHNLSNNVIVSNFLQLRLNAKALAFSTWMNAVTKWRVKEWKDVFSILSWVYSLLSNDVNGFLLKETFNISPVNSERESNLVAFVLM